MVVKNEEYWIWYSIMSVIDLVDSIDIVDTGSTDKTIEIIESIKSKKISLRTMTIKSKEEFTLVRQAQLESSKSDWIMILDGDEVWDERSLQESIELINNNSDTKYLVNKFQNFIGSVGMVQPDNASKYRIKDLYGPYTIRFVRRDLVGLTWKNPYGSEGLCDFSGTPLQETDLKYKVVMNPYMHMTHLQRSPADEAVLMRKNKFKFEVGKKLPNNYIYPKSFYLVSPKNVRSPWYKPSREYWIKSCFQTPLKLLKRLVDNA